LDLRDQNIEQLKREPLDVLIVGAGINGAVSAAALAAKGIKVAVIDRGDFAGETSSQSSNLAWGGIKYLENHEYGLVNELCQSRNHLMASYPSTVKEIRFLTTIAKGFRFPAPAVYAGTVLYWMFGRFVTRRPNYLCSSEIKQLEPIINVDNVQGGFEYSDCYLHDNDARFVFNFARRAMRHGGMAANYVESLGATWRDGLWHVQLRDVMSGAEFGVTAKVLINACGPYVDRHNQLVGQQTKHRHLFSKGIHLIVDRLTPSHKVLAFFASDGRLFFIMPMGPKTCIGTTDVQVSSPETSVTDEDRDFVLDNVNRLLSLDKPLTKADIISERCGVRPLASAGQTKINDWTEISRKHAIDINAEQQHMSIFGGKLTDCINVGNEVCEIVGELGIALNHNHQRWYGEPSEFERSRFMNQARAMNLDSLLPKESRQPSPEPLSQRFWRRYGSNAMSLLERIVEDPSCGELLIENAAYLRCEIELAAQTEMIVTLDDFLRRRSKIALVVDRETLLASKGLLQACEILFGDQAQAKLDEYMALVQ